MYWGMGNGGLDSEVKPYIFFFLKKKAGGSCYTDSTSHMGRDEGPRVWISLMGGWCFFLIGVKKNKKRIWEEQKTGKIKRVRFLWGDPRTVSGVEWNYGICVYAYRGLRRRNEKRIDSLGD